MTKKRFQIPALVADYDFSVVENALRQHPGVTELAVHRENKTFDITWDERANWEEIEEIIEDLGYVPEV